MYPRCGDAGLAHPRCGGETFVENPATNRINTKSHICLFSLRYLVSAGTFQLIMVQQAILDELHTSIFAVGELLS